MYHFKRMVENVRLHGIQMQPTYESTELKEEDLGGRSMDDVFFHYVEQCQPIVFSPSGEPTKDIVDGTSEMLELDGPFKVFSIEMAGKDNYLTVARAEGTSDACISCVLSIETRPKNYIQFLMIESRISGKSVVTIFDASSVTKEFIDRLNTEDLGVVSAKERIKIGRGSSKETVVLRKIVVCSPKKDHLESVGGRDVDWSHRWRVRGHWARLVNPSSIGKDRSGDYCVQGMTWRNEHIKGPEHMEVVDKVRLVRT